MTLLPSHTLTLTLTLTPTNGSLLYDTSSLYCVQAQYGVSSAFTYDLDLCRDMLCLMPGTNTCQGTLPFDGTTCGDQKVGQVTQ